MVGLLGLPYYVGILNDDACYVLRAFALSHGGSCPVCGQVLTQGREFALGWPLLLTPLVLLSTHLWLFRLCALLLTLASAVMLNRLAWRFFGAGVAPLCTGLFLFSTGTLWFATSTMSEPLFLCLICGLLTLTNGEQTARWNGLLVGALVGWCLATRTEGLAVLAAMLAWQSLSRRWREAASMLAVSLPLWFVVMLARPKGSPHFSQIASFFRSGDLAGYLASWAQAHARLQADCYFSGLGAAGPPLAVALSALAVWGGLRWWRERPGFGPWLGLALPAALLVWPYLHLRYWYPLLPVWILALAFALPVRLRAPGLASVLTIQLIGVALTSRLDVGPVVELYSALRQSPPQAVITCQYDCRVHLFSHRATVQPARSGSLAELLAFMASQGSDWVIWERRNQLVGHVHGGHQGEFAPDLWLWLERCPLLEPGLDTPAGTVRHLRVPGAQVAEGFRLYREALLASRPEARLASLEQCLAVCPDFPGVKLLWAFTAQELGRADPALVRRRTLEHLELYPHDFEGALQSLPMLHAMGDSASADAVVERALAEARRIGDSQALRTLLLNAGAKGGPREGDERPAP